MKESVARSYEIEEAKGGLVVRKALYGRLIGGSRSHLYVMQHLIKLFDASSVYRLSISQNSMIIHS